MGRRKNITQRQIAECAIWVKEFEPRTLQEKRDKTILTGYFIELLSPNEILEKYNPCVCKQNKVTDKRITSDRAIQNVIKKYFPDLERDVNDREKIQNKVRYEMLVTRDTEKPKICSACGSTENIEEHHFIPVKVGGRNQQYNRGYFCKNCHAKLSKEWQKITKILNVNGVIEVGSWEVGSCRDVLAKCSLCGNCIDSDKRKRYKFCPYCGARMDGEKR